MYTLSFSCPIPLFLPPPFAPSLSPSLLAAVPGDFFPPWGAPAAVSFRVCLSPFKVSNLVISPALLCLSNMPKSANKLYRERDDISSAMWIIMKVFAWGYGVLSTTISAYIWNVPCPRLQNKEDSNILWEAETEWNRNLNPYQGKLSKDMDIIVYTSF